MRFGKWDAETEKKSKAQDDKKREQRKAARKLKFMLAEQEKSNKNKSKN